MAGKVSSNTNDMENFEYESYHKQGSIDDENFLNIAKNIYSINAYLQSISDGINDRLTEMINVFYKIIELLEEKKMSDIKVITPSDSCVLDFRVEQIIDDYYMLVLIEDFHSLFPDVDKEKVIGIFGLCPELNGGTTLSSGMGLSDSNEISFVVCGDTESTSRDELKSLYVLCID